MLAKALSTKKARQKTKPRQITVNVWILYSFSRCIKDLKISVFFSVFFLLLIKEKLKWYPLYIKRK